MAVRTEDLDKAIAEVMVIGTDRLRKITAVPVTTSHMPCAQYDGMYDLPEESIILVICPLNSLIESHMKEWRQRSIQIACLCM